MKAFAVTSASQATLVPVPATTELSIEQLADEGYLQGFEPTDLINVFSSSTKVSAETAGALAASISGGKVSTAKTYNLAETKALLEQTDFDDYGTIEASQVESLMGIFNGADCYFVSEFTRQNPDTGGLVISTNGSNGAYSLMITTGRYE